MPDPIDQLIIKSLMSLPGVLQIGNSVGSHLQSNDQSSFSLLIREHIDAKSTATSVRLFQATSFQCNDLPAEPPCSSQQRLEDDFGLVSAILHPPLTDSSCGNHSKDGLSNVGRINSTHNTKCDNARTDESSCSSDPSKFMGAMGFLDVGCLVNALVLVKLHLQS